MTLNQESLMMMRVVLTIVVAISVASWMASAVPTISVSGSGYYGIVGWGSFSGTVGYADTYYYGTFTDAFPSTFPSAGDFSGNHIMFIFRPKSAVTYYYKDGSDTYAFVHAMSITGGAFTGASTSLKLTATANDSSLLGLLCESITGVISETLTDDITNDIIVNFECTTKSSSSADVDYEISSSEEYTWFMTGSENGFYMQCGQEFVAAVATEDAKDLSVANHALVIEDFSGGIATPYLCGCSIINKISYVHLNMRVAVNITSPVAPPYVVFQLYMIDEDNELLIDTDYKAYAEESDFTAYVKLWNDARVTSRYVLYTDSDYEDINGTATLPDLSFDGFEFTEADLDAFAAGVSTVVGVKTNAVDKEIATGVTRTVTLTFGSDHFCDMMIDTTFVKCFLYHSKPDAAKVSARVASNFVSSPGATAFSCYVDQIYESGAFAKIGFSLLLSVLTVFAIEF